MPSQEIKLDLGAKGRGVPLKGLSQRSMVTTRCFENPFFLFLYGEWTVAGWSTEGKPSEETAIVFQARDDGGQDLGAWGDGSMEMNVGLREIGRHT